MELIQPREMPLAFLTVIESSNGSLRGGYLLTTDHGRPIEFHYTQPVRFSPQERALYGRQFGPLVYAELMALPLTERQSAPPKAIFVNIPHLLHLRRKIPAPVFFVKPPDEGAIPHVEWDADYPNDGIAFEKLRTLAPANFDWLEPFDRISAALDTLEEDQMRMAA